MSHSNSLRLKAIRKERVFSIHKLIEYGFSSPQLRTRIIENAMTPPVFIMDTKYPDIERAAADFLKSNCINETRLLDLDGSYLRRKSATEHEEQRLLNAHDAIEHVRRMDWKIPVGTNLYLASDLPDCMEISGLRIRVKPTILVKRLVNGTTTPAIGVGKPYFGKSFPLHTNDDRERGTLFATLLQWYTEQTLDHIGEADPALCFVGDVFSEKTHSAAKRYKQRRKQLAALAQEISDRWEPIRLRLETDSEHRKTARKG